MPGNKPQNCEVVVEYPSPGDRDLAPTGGGSISLFARDRTRCYVRLPHVCAVFEHLRVIKHGGMPLYETKLASLDSYQKAIEIVDDDRKHHAFSNYSRLPIHRNHLRR